MKFSNTSFEKCLYLKKNDSVYIAFLYIKQIQIHGIHVVGFLINHFVSNKRQLNYDKLKAFQKETCILLFFANVSVFKFSESFYAARKEKQSFRSLLYYSRTAFKIMAMRIEVTKTSVFFYCVEWLILRYLFEENPIIILLLAFSSSIRQFNA